LNKTYLFAEILRPQNFLFNWALFAQISCVSL